MGNYQKLMFGNNTLTETIEDCDNKDKFTTDYSADKLNELYNEFDSITLDNSSIDTLTERNAKSVEKVGARTKLYLTAGVLIATLLLFLVIYNFFVLSNVAHSIDILQDDLTYQEYQVMDKTRRLNEMTDSDAVMGELVEMGYSEVTSQNVVNYTASEVNALQGETNWFDKLCGFINGVFGG